MYPWWATHQGCDGHGTLVHALGGLARPRSLRSMNPSGDEIIGVPLQRAAEILGVRPRRLSGWASIDLVTPSISGALGDSRRTFRSYALDDLVQGCIIRILEDEHNQDIRTISHFVRLLRSDDHPRPLSELRWGVADGEIFAMYPDGSWVGKRKPTQTVATQVLHLEEIRVEMRRRARERPRELAGHTTRSRGVMGSKETFAGTRIPVSSVLAYLERGHDDSRVLDAYPDLFPEDLELARRRLAS